MTLEEFNRWRRLQKKAALAGGFSFFAMALTAAAKLGVLCAASVVSLVVAGAFFGRCLKKTDAFRCPRCGEKPHEWASPDPTFEAASYEPETQVCRHCGYDLPGA
jgi:ribosomal protein L37E